MHEFGAARDRIEMKELTEGDVCCMEKRTGGIIAAAKKIIKNKQVYSMQPVGEISAIKRVVLTLLKAEVNPIVIITGYDSDVLEHELAAYPIMFLKIGEYEQAELLDLAKEGIRFLENQCEQVVFTPVDVPLVRPDTLSELMQIDALAAAPAYHGEKGHPILLSRQLFPLILDYQGDGGIIGALHFAGIERTWLEVEDRGVLSDLNHLEQDADLIEQHNHALFRPFLRIRLEKDSSFMGGRMKLLLTLIDETHSVHEACKHIPVSSSKAWSMLNHLEKELGYKVVFRQHGGKNGGKTGLTPEGKQLLKCYSEFEYRVQKYAMEEFQRIFLEFSMQSDHKDD